MSKNNRRGLAFPPLVLGGKKLRLPPSEAAATEAETLELDTAADAPPPVVEPMDEVEALFQPPASEPLPQSEPIYPNGDLPELELIPASERLESEKVRKAEKPVKPLKVKAEKVKVEKIRPQRAAPASPAAAEIDGPEALRLPIWARWAYPVAIALAVSLGGAMVAFSYSYKNSFGAFEYRPFPVIVFSALALLPVLFILLTAYVLRQAAKMSLETRRARAMADELAIPAALAVDHASGAAEAVRREVARATEAGEAAERQLLSLRDTLAAESERLVAATEAAERTARTLTESLSREREEITALASGLDTRVTAINDAIERQTRLVTETSDLAAAQLQEAEAALAARATDLAAAAGEAGEAAELAGEALARQAERLESVGDLVGTRLQVLHDGLGRGHSRLADLAVQLQADQEALAERLEIQRLAAAETYAGVAAAADSAESVTSTLRDLIVEADERLRDVAERVQGEQAALDARARAALSLFRDAVSEEREAIEAETAHSLSRLAESAAASREAAGAGAEAARAQIEQLGEAAFAAGQRADQAFDAHLTSARRAIEAAADMVAEAGAGVASRIDTGLESARGTLGEITAMLAAVDQRIAEAPAEARAQAAAVRRSVDASLAELAVNARRLALEAEGADAALQERVRKNYETLADALKTMGKVAAATEHAAARSAAQASIAPPPAVAAPAPVQPAPRPVVTPAAAAFAERAIRVPIAPAALAGLTATPTMAAEPRPAPTTPASTDIGLRPRLRLTPEPEPAPARAFVHESVDEPRPPPVTHETLAPFVKPAAASASPAPAGREAAWSWKDLLSSIDEPPIDDEVLAERLISEIEALGLDAATLLPLAQIDTLAEAMQRGDGESVREAVRALAPGAVRRLSRRVLTDKVLRAHADRYVRRYEDLLNDSARRDQEGFMTAALLGSDPGRAFLLFDAAVGELH